MEQRQLRILAIGAHPDDCEFYIGGTAAKYRSLGHAVRFVSLTNGNAGHQTLGRKELAQRRAGEAAEVSRLTAIEYEILDNDDGALTASLAVREQVICIIRRFQPDFVFTHRPFDYHPDHRSTGQLVQDSAYLLGVPAVCPTVQCMRRMPVILSFHDNFTRPVAFRADVAVGIDEAMNDKVRMLDCHKSQVYEWLPWVDRGGEPVPVGENERLGWLEENVRRQDAGVAQCCREGLIERYGAQRGQAVRCAEAFEVSEYGSPMTKEQIPEYFPF